MLAEPAGVLWFVVITVFMPGVGLLVLAGSRFAGSPRGGSAGLRSVSRTLGIAFIAATALLGLYLLPRLLDGPRAGGLGSTGDPLGAILSLGYIFVLAPFAVLTLASIGIVHALRWRRARRRS
jgi:hypothetical protein